ncbi:MAG: YqgE/AlgH family protein [Pseudomonadota bacterium]
MKKYNIPVTGILLLVLAGFMLSVPGWIRNYDGLAGHVLMASPQLNDPNFQKTVVLITEHNPLMARGYVLNRPLSDSEDGDYRRWGGPLAPDDVHILTHNNSAEAKPVAETGLYTVAPDPHYDRSEADLFLSGYASWGIGQLEAEIEAGDWQVRVLTPDILEQPYQEIWSNLQEEQR